MKWQSQPDQLITYRSFEEIYTHKKGVSDHSEGLFWMFPLPRWKFLFLSNRDAAPIDFYNTDYNDASWEVIDVPSVWQQKGYGYPSHLLYEEMRPQPKRKGFLKKNIERITSVEKEDPVGIYRVAINIPEHYLKRAVYFLSEGINGRFELYVNGRLVSRSHAVFSLQKCLLSEYIKKGKNQLTLLVYRLNQGEVGPDEEKGTFGFSGLFRMPYIIAEPLLAIEKIKLDYGFQGQLDFSPEHSTKKDETSSTVIKASHDDQGISTDVKKEDTDKDQNAALQNARLMIDCSLFNHLPRSVSVQFEYKIIRVEQEYDIYKLPEIRVKRSKNKPVHVTGRKNTCFKEELFVYSIIPWTDITPTLYDLIIEIKDEQGRLIDVKKVRFAFRTVQIVNDMFCINDTAVPLHAVRYYCFDPVGGLQVSKKTMKQDIALMKQAQINCVFTPYFPQSSEFLSLCDKAGLYVICGDHYSRMKNTIDSLSLHPSIIMWAPSFYEDELGDVQAEKNVWKTQDGRPVFVPDRDSKISDLSPFPGEAGVIYGYWQDICIDRRARVECLRPGEKLFESISGRPAKDEDDPNYRYIHQGDLEEYHEHKVVAVSQGIVSAHRKPHPIYYEIKKQCERLKIFADPDNPEILTIYNTYPLGQTGAMRLEWYLHIGGHQIKGGGGAFPALKAFEHRKIRFPFTMSDYIQISGDDLDQKTARALKESYIKELILDVRILTAISNKFVSEGHELLYYQETILNEVTEKEFVSVLPGQNDLIDIAIIDNKRIDPYISTTPASIFAQPRMLETKISFSRKMGALESFCINKADFFSDVLMPSFYRAATNMDRSDQSYILSSTVFSKETNWRSIQSNLEFKRTSYEMEGDDFTMLSVYSTAGMKNEVLVFYRYTPLGRLEATLSFTPDYEPVRFGFRFRAPMTANQISWYGLGPKETYSDRKESAKWGFYSSRCEDMIHHYARPSESGVRCCTRVLILEDQSGSKMKITRKDHRCFSFTVTPFSPEEVDDAMHSEDLIAQESFHVFIDFYQKDVERTEKPPKTVHKSSFQPETFIFEPVWEG